MKRRVFLSLLTVAAVLGNAAVPASAPEKIAAVKAGKITEARASWWGFDEADSTEFLQAALSSGVKKLTIDYTGKDWIVNRTLELPSNMELVVADQVVVRAKKDCFKRLGDALMRGKGIRNFTLRGEGSAKLVMNKKDYQDKTRYKLGEWRHTLSMHGVTDLTIRDIELASSGGDGIYFGSWQQPYCKNVTVRNVTFRDHNRLGVAVISAENLLIDNCRFLDTKGASPAGGLDFEPNRPGERLANCEVRNSLFRNCYGAAISVSPNHLNKDSVPVSIKISNCRAENNGLGLFLYPSRRSKIYPAKGKVLIENCSFVNSVNTLQDPVQNSVDFTIRNCSFTGKGDAAIFDIRCKHAQGRKLGGLRFDNVSVKASSPKAVPFTIEYLGSGDVSDDISGTVSFNGKAFDLAGFVRARQAYFKRVNALEYATEIDLAKLRIPARGGAVEANNQCYLRGHFVALQFARKGENITVEARAVSGGYPQNVPLELQSPSGKKIKTHILPINGKVQKITFTAAETGYYRLVGQTVQRVILASAHPGSAVLIERGFRTLLPVAGQLWFEVPEGVKDFTVGVSSNAGADISLIDAGGKEVKRVRKVHSMELLEGKRDDASRSELWSIRVNRAVWEVHVRLYKPLLPLFGFNPATLPLLGDPARRVLPPAAKTAAPVMLNAGFERFRSGAPLYWRAPGAGNVLKPMDRKPAEGLQVLSLKAGKSCSLMSYSFIPVKSGASYRLSVQARGKGRLQLEVSRYDAAGKWLRPNRNCADRKIDSPEFQTVSGVFTAPAGTNRVRFCIAAAEGSDLELDDCRFEAVAAGAQTN